MAELGDVVVVQLLQNDGVHAIEFRLEETEGGKNTWSNIQPINMQPGDQLYMRPLFAAMRDGDAVHMNHGSEFVTPVPIAAPQAIEFDVGGLSGPVFPPAKRDEE